MITDRVQMYYWMALCRALDDALCRENDRWFPARGEEATIVGTFFGLRDTDVIAAHYRDPFVAYLMRGAELWRLIAQVLGKRSGYNGGRSVPFTGPADQRIVPWVAGDLGTSIGVATGAALACRLDRAGAVCVCSFGDGTSNRGDFHENINIAALWQLPIVYVCQNNGWSISQAANTYLPAPVAARAQGYGIPGITVDGNDVEEVRRAVGVAVERARNGEGPSLIDAQTQRARGHWVADSEKYRNRNDDAAWTDPVTAYAARLIETREAGAEDIEEIGAAVDREVDAALSRAKAEMEVTAEDLGLDEVYA